MNTYSYWEMGRNIGSGRIASMMPIDLSSTASSLGGINLGQAGMALSSIAQFGIYMEMRKMNLLREAEFEERRHNWIVDITNQWIEEHSNEHGILRDVTLAVSKDCEKMWKKVWENEKIDVPQTLLLRLKRMADFLDWNYTVTAHANNYLVEATGSDNAWLLDPDMSSEIWANQILEKAADEPQSDFWGGLLKTAVGIPLVLIPFVGPLVGGVTIGKGLGDMKYTGRMSEAERERLQDKLPLLQFGIAANMIDSATQQVEHLLEQQKFKEPMRFLATETGPHDISFLLDRVTPIETRKMPTLKPVPLPKDSESEPDH